MRSFIGFHDRSCACDLSTFTRTIRRDISLYHKVEQEPEFSDVENYTLEPPPKSLVPGSRLPNSRMVRISPRDVLVLMAMQILLVARTLAMMVHTPILPRMIEVRLHL